MNSVFLRCPFLKTVFQTHSVEVDEGVAESQAGKAPYQVCGHRQRRIGHQVEVRDDEEEAHVFQVVSVRAANALNVAVCKSDGAPAVQSRRGAVLRVGEHLRIPANLRLMITTRLPNFGVRSG